MWPRGDAGRAGAGAPRSGLRARLERARGCGSADRPASAAAASRPPAPGPQRGAAAGTAGSGRPRLPAGGRSSRRAMAPSANCRRSAPPRRDAPGRAGAGRAAGGAGRGWALRRGGARTGRSRGRSARGRGAGPGTAAASGPAGSEVPREPQLRLRASGARVPPAARGVPEREPVAD